MTTSTTLRPRRLGPSATPLLDTAGTSRSPARAPPTTGRGGSTPVDAVLDITGLSGVLAHNPGDMTVAVHAGTPLRALATSWASTGSGSRSTPRASPTGPPSAACSPPPTPARRRSSTAGCGTWSSASPSVLADGTVARSGGHVIKNVAGYDLAKLFHGSLRHARGGGRDRAAAAPVPKRPADAGWSMHAPPMPPRSPGACSAGPYHRRRWNGCPGRARDGGCSCASRARRTRCRPGSQRLRELLGFGAREATTARRTRHARADTVVRHAALVRGARSRGPARGRHTGRCRRCSANCRPAPSTAGLGTGVATVTVAPEAVAGAHAPWRRRRDVRPARPPGRIGRSGLGAAAVRARRAQGGQEPARTRRPARPRPLRPLDVRKS